MPLNVLAGGQASPRDSGSQNQNSGSARARRPRRPDAHRDKVAEVLAAFFDRQSKVVLTRIGAGADWWDGKRWDAELADDLLRVTHTVAEILGKREADRLGYPDGLRRRADRELPQGRFGTVRRHGQ